MATEEQIAGRYQLQGKLGTGGMSTVRLAFDRRLERQVAIKLLAEHLAEEENFVSRFRREALAAARLVHPNIVQVFDFGLDESSGEHFIVMEYVAGSSCAQLLRDQRVLGIEQVVNIVGQACHGLEHAHRNGVVHRDVKPGNLLVSDDGVVKLADFGIAKATEQSSITQVGSVLGTAAYLAPEQARGEEAGPLADQYALGVVTYQMLAGRLPYEAASLTELAFKQQREPPVALEELNPEVPVTLARAIAHSMRLDPAARYPGALAMGEALRAGAQGIDPGPGEDATAATAMLDRGAQTDATHALPSRPPAAPRRAPMQPRRGPPPPPEPPPAPGLPRRAPSRAGRLLRRLVVLLVVIGLVVLAVVIASDSLSDNPRLRRVTGDTVQQTVDNVKNLIDDNRR